MVFTHVHLFQNDTEAEVVNGRLEFRTAENTTRVVMTGEAHKLADMLRALLPALDEIECAKV